MQPPEAERKRRARWSLSVLFFALFGTMIIGMVGGSLVNKLLIGAATPPDAVLLPIGMLMFLMGLHHVVFRREDAQLYREQRESWGLSSESQTPGLMVVGGAAFMLLGLIFAMMGVSKLFASP